MNAAGLDRRLQQLESSEAGGAVDCPRCKALASEPHISDKELADLLFNRIEEYSKIFPDLPAPAPGCNKCFDPSSDETLTEAIRLYYQ